MPQENPFQSFARGLSSPAGRHVSIVPEDGADLPVRPRVLRINSTGVLRLRDETGQLFDYNVRQGEVLLFSPVGVEATGTTAEVVGWL